MPKPEPEKTPLMKPTKPTQPRPPKYPPFSDRPEYLVPDLLELTTAALEAQVKRITEKPERKIIQIIETGALEDVFNILALCSDGSLFVGTITRDRRGARLALSIDWEAVDGALPPAGETP